MDGVDLSQRVEFLGKQGLRIPRIFTRSGQDPLQTVEWEYRSSAIKNPDGSVVFEMGNIEVPKSWSQVALDVTAQKYFKKASIPQFDKDGKQIFDEFGKPVFGPERSVRQVLKRLAGCWRHWGEKFGYFASPEDAQAFEEELLFMLVHQTASPNSPQWFNTGLHWAYGVTGSNKGAWFVDPLTKELVQSQDEYSHPQAHACADYYTIVYTDNGPRFIGEIVENNLIDKKVFDGEKFVEILATKYNGKKKVYKIKTKNGNFVELTGDHLVFASETRLKDGGKYAWFQVQELKPEMKIVQPIVKNAVEKEVDEKELAKARLVGWIIGDGFSGKLGDSIGFQIVTVTAEEHDSIIKDIKTIFGEEVSYWVTKFETQNKSLQGKRINLVGEKAKTFLYKYNLLNKTSRTVEVPEEILKNNELVIREFLKALFQADGCVRIRENSGKITLTTVSEKLAFQILQLLNILGIYSRINIEEEKRENRANPNYLNISYGNSREIFQQLIGFISSNKIEKLALLNKSVMNSKNVPIFREETIVSIEEVGTRDVYDIQTESGRFLANGIIVHNCFIQPINDDLLNEGGIYDLVRKEALIFKHGSGSGTNFSTLRAKGEPLSGGGVSSGLMTFLKIFDVSASSVKSGGITRRAAKMVILNIDHPEIENFINWKVNEERKVAAMVLAGYSPDFEGEAYQTVSGQNSNNSVRVTDDFVNAALNNKDWNLTWRTNGKVAKTVKARDLWNQIAKAAWACADPGLQFDTTCNDWNTCPATDRINATNPCSEFNFLDNTACNLSSINLLKFFDYETATFDVESFKHVVRLWTIVLEISVLMAQLPSKEIAQRTYETRSLGLGYTNLGAMLMVAGIPYDSNEARAISAAITAIMTGESYATSAEMASFLGPFTEYEKNREHMLRVIRNHRRAVYNAKPEEYENISIVPQGINHKICPPYLLEAAIESWDRALQLGEKYGFRNAQSTLIAPTGTISLQMDCDTTGIEPDFAIVKFKKLVGGGFFKLINQSVVPALKRLGYTTEQIGEIIQYTLGKNTFRGAPYINDFSLRTKGFTDEEIAKLEKILPGVFDLNQVFTFWNLGKETIERLGFTEEQYNKSNFNFLKELGFSSEEIEAAGEYACGTVTLEGAPHLKEEHYAIFDCANKCGKKGKRFIDYMAHVKMMAAAQPFLSGSISKTINMPNEAAVEDVQKVYIESWKLGLKSIALYRDGSKLSQPLNALAEREKKKEEEKIAIVRPVRKRLPDERRSVTHKFQVGNQEGYITVGLYEDGSPGEIFIQMAKEGSTLSGLMDAFALSIAMSLQYGVPLKVLVNKFIHYRFEPSGWTNNPQIQIAKSIVDYIFRWLALKFLPEEELDSIGINLNKINGTNGANGEHISKPAQEPVDIKPITEFTRETSNVKIETPDEIKFENNTDATACDYCGSLMIRSGSCYLCLNCGATSGCS